MIMNNERIRLGEWEFGDRLRYEKDTVKSQFLLPIAFPIAYCLFPIPYYITISGKSYR